MPEEYTPSADDFVKVVTEAINATGARISSGYRPGAVVRGKGTASMHSMAGGAADLQIPGGSPADHQRLAQYLQLRGYNTIVETPGSKWAAPGNKGIVVHVERRAPRVVPSVAAPVPPRPQKTLPPDLQRYVDRATGLDMASNLPAVATSYAPKEPELTPAQRNALALSLLPSGNVITEIIQGPKTYHIAKKPKPKPYVWPTPAGMLGAPMTGPAGRVATAAKQTQVAARTRTQKQAKAAKQKQAEAELAAAKPLLESQIYEQGTAPLTLSQVAPTATQMMSMPDVEAVVKAPMLATARVLQLGESPFAGAVNEVLNRRSMGAPLSEEIGGALRGAVQGAREGTLWSDVIAEQAPEFANQVVGHMFYGLGPDQTFPVTMGTLVGLPLDILGDITWLVPPAKVAALAMRIPGAARVATAISRIPAVAAIAGERRVGGAMREYIQPMRVGRALEQQEAGRLAEDVSTMAREEAGRGLTAPPEVTPTPANLSLRANAQAAQAALPRYEADLQRATADRVLAERQLAAAPANRVYQAGHAAALAKEQQAAADVKALHSSIAAYHAQVGLPYVPVPATGPSQLETVAEGMRGAVRTEAENRVNARLVGKVARAMMAARRLGVALRSADASRMVQLSQQAAQANAALRAGGASLAHAQAAYGALDASVHNLDLLINAVSPAARTQRDLADAVRAANRAKAQMTNAMGRLSAAQGVGVGAGARAANVQALRQARAAAQAGARASRFAADLTMRLVGGQRQIAREIALETRRVARERGLGGLFGKGTTIDFARLNPQAKSVLRAAQPHPLPAVAQMPAWGEPVQAEHVRQLVTAYARGESLSGKAANPAVARAETLNWAQAAGIDRRAFQRVADRVRRASVRSGQALKRMAPQLREEIDRIVQEGGYLRRMYGKFSNTRAYVEGLRAQGKHAEADALEDVLRNVVKVDWGERAHAQLRALAKRKNLPIEVRRELGEISDAVPLIMKQGEVVSNTVPKLTAFEGMAHDSRLAWPTRKPGWVRMPQGEQWGELSGMYVHPFVHTALTGARGERDKLIPYVWRYLMSPTIEPIRPRDPVSKVIAGFTRQMKPIWTVLNPAFHARNLTTNMLTAYMWGGIPFHEVGFYFGKAAKELTKNGMRSPIIRELAQHTPAFADTSVSQELARMAGRGQASALAQMQKLGGVAGRVGRAGERLANVPGQVFQFNERVARLAVAMHAMDKGTSAKVAAALGDHAIFDYGDVPRWVEIMRTYGVGTPFATYPFKVAQTMGRELWRNPAKMANVVKVLADLEKTVPEPQRREAWATAPEWMKPGENLLVPIRVHGGIVMLNTGYQLPWQNVVGQGNIVSQFIATPLGPLVAAWSHIENNRTELGQEIYPENAPIHQKITAVSNYLEREFGMRFEPGSLRWQSWGQTLSGEQVKQGGVWGQPPTIGQQVAADLLGVKTYTLEPGVAEARKRREVGGQGLRLLDEYRKQGKDASDRLRHARTPEDRAYWQGKLDELKRHYQGLVQEQGRRMRAIPGRTNGSTAAR